MVEVSIGDGIDWGRWDEVVRKFGCGLRPAGNTWSTVARGSQGRNRNFTPQTPSLLPQTPELQLEINQHAPNYRCQDVPANEEDDGPCAGKSGPVTCC